MSKLSTWLGRGPAARIPSEAAVFRLQTAAYGLAVPIVYGTARVSGNVVHLFDQQTTSSVEKQKAGKGAKIETTTYSYTAAVVIALAEGDVAGVGTVWRDKDKFTWAQMQAAGWTRALGTPAQPTWPALASKQPAEAIPYAGTAYVAHAALDLPDNAVPNFSWEVQGRCQVGGGVVDAHPVDALVDLLTNAAYGAGWAAARLGDLSAATTYARAMGLYGSPVLAEARPLREHAQMLCTLAHCAAVWSDGVLKLVPYGDAPVTGNGVTYTPNTTPLYDLTDADFLREGDDDPVEVTRGTTADAYNQLNVEYEDRASDYNSAVQEGKDQAAIERYGLCPAPVLKLPAVKDAAVARLLAQLGVQRTAYVRNTYRFRLSWRYALLEPMDLVTLTDPELGLDRAPVRLTRVEDGDDDAITVTAEDWPLGIASATRYPAAANRGYTPATGADPGATVAQALIAPAVLSTSTLEAWVVASGGADWGGCEVWLSADGVQYDRVGAITQRGVLGRLTAGLAAGGGATLALNLGADGVANAGQLVSVTDAALDASVTLGAVLTNPPELLAFRDATLTAAARYSCTTLRRGLYGSTDAAAAAGTPYVWLDGAVFRLALATAKAGQTVYLKLPAFNAYGGALQPLASVAPLAVPITRDPTAPGGAGGGLEIEYAPTATGPWDGSFTPGTDRWRHERPAGSSAWSAAQYIVAQDGAAGAPAFPLLTRSDAAGTATLAPDGTGASRTAGGGWGVCSVYGRDAFDAPWASWRSTLASGTEVMAGLNRDPLLVANSAPGANDAYARIDYAFYERGDGALFVYESGTPIVGIVGGWSSATRQQVQVERRPGGRWVRYLRDGVVVYEHAIAGDDGAPLAFNAALATLGADVLAVTGGLTGPGGANGTNGRDLEIEYSVDGANPTAATGAGGWHYPRAAGDKYSRERYVGDATWGAVAQDVGEDGLNGSHPVSYYQRATSRPATPAPSATFADLVAAGWSDVPAAGAPADTEGDYETRATFRDAAQLTAWCAPLTLRGPKGTTGDKGDKGDPGAAGTNPAFTALAAAVVYAEQVLRISYTLSPEFAGATVTIRAQRLAPTTGVVGGTMAASGSPFDFTPAHTPDSAGPNSEVVRFEITATLPGGGSVVQARTVGYRWTF